MPIKVPVTQTGLEASIEAAAKSAGRKLKINLGTSAKSIEGLSQPLGRITGKADQFTKSMEAANARVLAFGASVGVLSAVTRGFQQLVTTTIDVEKRLTAINSILGGTASQLDSFKKTIFDVAKNTEQSFGVVADAALELSRQGLKAEEVTKRLNDSLVLARLSGLGATEAVAGLTAAINSFNREGVTSAQVLNKLSAAAVSAAVSERDLIEGIKRSGAVAIQAGVSLDELVGVITAVQTKTARGGAVIGNSFKTIFTRIQSLDKLQTMQNLGVQVTDLNGDVLSGTKLIENLAKALSSVPDARRLQIAENLVGKFQVAPFLAILDDYNSKTSTAIEVTKISQKATTEAYERNKALNETLSAAINSTVVSVQQLAETLGSIGVTDNLKGILTFFNNLVSGLQDLLDGDSLGSKFAKGIVAGIGNVLSGPGLAIFGAIIAKLTIDLAKFGVGSLNTFFGLNKAAKEQATLQGQIASTLLGNSDIQKRILTIENSTLSVEQKRAAQTKFFTTALNEQLAVMTRMQAIAAKVTPGVFAGTRGGKGRAAGGFIPNYNAVMGYGSERADISRGVGGAPSSAKPVSIPNFNFGGGQKGTMVANTSEYMVPNFAGTGGSAIFNQDMVTSMGLPSGAKKIGAAGGYIPNFAAVPTAFSELVRRRVPGAFSSTGNFSSLAAQKELRLPFSSDAQMRNLYANSSLRTSFDKLSPTQKRNLKQQGRQRAVTAKGTDQLAKFGILYPDAIGQQKPVTLTIDKTPVRAIPVATDPPNKLYKEIRKSLVKSAKKYANSLGFVPDIIKDAKFGKAIDRNLNEGSIEAAYGSVFEAAFQGAMGTEQKSGTRWDLANPAAIETLMGMIKSNGMLQGIRPQLAGITSADFKNSLSPENLASIKGKIKASTGKKKRAAGGYIPSFAAPLQEAVARETAAGLPINQVRINQDASLRNSANPMGLAITNTRDEPTGAIPNFAKGGKATAGEAQDVMGGLVGKMLAVQIGMSALSGILGEVTNENKLVAGSLKLLNIAVSAALVSQSFGGAKGIMGGIGNVAGTFVGRGGLAARGASMMSRGRSNIAFAASDLAGARRGGLRGLAAGGGRLAARGGASALMGGLKVAGGALLRFAGPIGAVAGTALLVNKGLNALNGSTAAVKAGQEALGRAAENAAMELSELRFEGERERKDFKDTSASLGNQVAARVAKRGFVGVGNDKAQTENIRGLVESVYNAGATSAEVDKIFADFDPGTRQVTRPNYVAGTGMGGFSVSGMRTDTVQNPYTSEQSKGIVEALELLSKVDFSGRQEALSKFVSEDAGLRKDLASDDASVRKAAEDRVSKKALELKVATELKATPIAEGREAGKAADEEKLARSAQVRADIAKAQAISELKILEIKSKAIDNLDIELQRGQLLNTLSESELSALKNKIALRDEDRNLNSQISGLLQEEINKVEKLTVEEEKRESLKKAIKGINLEDLKDTTKREVILNKLRDLAGEELDISQLLNQLFGEGVNQLLDQSNARKGNISLTEKETQAQIKLNEATKKALSVSRRGNLDKSRIQEFDRGSRLREIALERAEVNPNLAAQAKARLETGFVKREGDINIEEAEAKAVEETKSALEDLTDEMPFLKTELLGLVEILNTLGVGGLEQVTSRLGEIGEGKVQGMQFKQGPMGIPIPVAIPLDDQQKEKFKDKKSDADQSKRDIQTAKEQAALQLKIAQAQERVADGFKSYSVLLREFTDSLRQQAEQLKVDLVKSRDGASILSNINEQLFTRQARGGGAGNIANAATNAAITGLRDQAFLAGSARESRGFTRQVDIVREQLQLKEEFVKLQEDEVVNEPKLIALKQRILQLEKERLQVNETLGAKFEDEFIKSDREIQNEFNDSLVSSARQFSTTLSEGLTDAIAKGESLGDTLKQAAANFFLEQSKNNFNTALSKGLQIFGFNAGGKVAGGSGARDDVPALLTGGEFVMNRKAVDKYGSAFMSSLNQGSIPTMNKGGLFTPGTFGQGAMKGKRNLLDFATQSFTTGKFDKVSGGSGFASIGLEPQSAALTMFGRRNSPQFQKEQASKKQAFGLFVNQVEKEKEFKDSQTSLGDVLLNAVKTFAISTAVKGLVGRAANAASFGKVGKDGIGRAMPLNEDGTEMSFLQRMMLPLPEKKATGGSIPYAAGVDTVPAMLSGGEFVMNAAATQRVGRGTLSSINSGGGAGNNGAVIGKLDELISVSENSGETNINITVNSDGTSDQSGNGNDQESNLALKIRDVVRQVIDDEKRLGGSLRQARA
jgi:TP901 family phage tail tape measure protein